MAQLYELALRYQQALDGLHGSISSVEADAAGRGLHHAMSDMVKGADSSGASAPEARPSFAPIVLRTTLASSIVAYVESIPWAQVTPQMLHEAEPGHLSALEVASRVFQLLFANAILADSISMASSPVAALLLRQVWSPLLNVVFTLRRTNSPLLYCGQCIMFASDAL